MKPNNKLPENWLVLSPKFSGKDLDLFKIQVIGYLNGNYEVKYHGDVDSYYGVINGRATFYGNFRGFKCESIGGNPTFLTLEEFIKLKNEPTEPTKPVGYLSPINLFESTIRKGTIFVKSKYDPRLYHPIGTRRADLNIPKEIVEAWEPVYTLEKPKVEFEIEAKSKRNGRKVLVKCTIQKDSQVIEFTHPDKGYKVHIDSFIKALETIDKFSYQCPSMGGIHPIMETFTLSCTTFSVEDIRTVIKKYKEVNK